MIGTDMNKQILVADGEPGFIVKMAALLEDYGYDVLTADSFQGAQRKAFMLDVDLILIGDSLKDMPGLDFCKRIKSFKRTGHIPVIFLTRNYDSEIRDKGYMAGADDCFARDFEHNELFARIEAVWRRGLNRPADHKDPVARNALVREIKRIIDEEMVLPHFQPIYFLKPFRFLGVEVLSRPLESEYFSDPEDLFQTAIKYDLYYPLEMMCWRKAAEIVAAKTRNELIFFNCTPFVVENRKFSLFSPIFRQSRIPFNKIVLEITERSAIKDYSTFCRRMSECRDEGFSFAVDDLGSGYATLESIIATKPEIVKIAQHITRNIDQDAIKSSMVKFIVAFCRENDILTIAEGVETQEELNAVISLGVDAVQGYLLYKPASHFDLHSMKDTVVAFG